MKTLGNKRGVGRGPATHAHKETEPWLHFGFQFRGSFAQSGRVQRGNPLTFL